MKKIKNLLPYIAIPFVVTAYLVFRHTEDAVTILRAISLITFGCIAAILDLKTRRVPNKLVLVMFSVWIVIVSVYLVIDINEAVEFVIQSLLTAVVGGGFFLLIYLISRKGIGGGDVKLLAGLGLFMTLAKLMPMLFISSLSAALVSVILLLTKKATAKSTIPLVPFLYLGTLIVVFM